MRTEGANSWHAFAREIKIYTEAGIAGSTIIYDVNGNMTQDGDKCYEYNEANKMKAVKKCSNNQTIAEYIYDYKGQRMVKKNYTNGSLANTVISWSDSFETKAIVGGGTETTNYFFANGELIAKKKPNGSKQFYHNDHLNSSVLITDESGDIVEETEFDPWGMVLSGATQSKFQYTGQEHDSETGLHYYDARYYDPDLKRFTQPDPFVQDVYNPQNLNRYSYVLNNPLKYVDPTGNNFASLFSAAVNAAKQVVKTVSNFFTPKPPASNFKLPPSPAFNQPINRSSNSSGGGGGGGNNGGGGSTSVSVFNTGGSGGGGGTSVPSSQHQEAAAPQHRNSPNLVKGASTKVSNSYNNGHIDIGGNVRVFGNYGITAGAQINREGITPYLGKGLILGGGKYGGAVMFADNKPSEESMSLSVQGTFPIVHRVVGPAGSLSYPLERYIPNLASPSVDGGIGIGAGLSVTINQTFKTIKF